MEEDPKELEEDESSIKEGFERFYNYEENSISVQKIQDVETMTHEEEDGRTCTQNFNTNRGQIMLENNLYALILIVVNSGCPHDRIDYGGAAETNHRIY